MSPAEQQQHNSSAVRKFDGILIGFVVAVTGAIAAGATGLFS